MEMDGRGTEVAGERLAKLPAGLAKAIGLKHLPSLDGLRAIAAFLVVFYHFGFQWCPGGLGVLAFFVLSGFLITWLLLKEEERFGSISLKLFYVRRSLRIFPAFYAYWLLLVGFLLLSHRRVAGAQAICSFVYANNYYQAVFGDPNTGLSHTWSLGIEEQFYLLWPLTFLLLKQTRNRIRFLAIGILTVWTYREALVFLAHVHQGYIYEAFDTRADHLMIGCLLAVLLRAGVCGRLWRGLCFSSRLAWGTLVALAASTACAIHFGSDYRDSVGFIVDPLLVAALIVQTLAHPAAGLGIALNWRWVRYLGTISYSVYLYQQIAIGPAKKLAAHWPALALPVTTAAVILVASGSYWLIERPFLRLKKRYEAGRQAR